MFKIDIHTHILPENLNELTETFTDKRFLRIKMIDEMYDEYDYQKMIKKNIYDNEE